MTPETHDFGIVAFFRTLGWEISRLRRAPTRAALRAPSLLFVAEEVEVRAVHAAEGATPSHEDALVAGVAEADGASRQDSFRAGGGRALYAGRFFHFPPMLCHRATAAIIPPDVFLTRRWRVA